MALKGITFVLLTSCTIDEDDTVYMDVLGQGNRARGLIYSIGEPVIAEDRLDVTATPPPINHPLSLTLCGKLSEAEEHRSSSFNKGNYSLIFKPETKVIYFKSCSS